MASGDVPGTGVDKSILFSVRVQAARHSTLLNDSLSQKPMQALQRYRRRRQVCWVPIRWAGAGSRRTTAVRSVLTGPPPLVNR